MVADVRKRVKNGTNGKHSDTSLTGSDSHSKELAEVKKILVEHKKKQDYIVTLLHHVCSKLPGALPGAATSGNVCTDEATKGGVYTLESSFTSEHTPGSDDND